MGNLFAGADGFGAVVALVACWLCCACTQKHVKADGLALLSAVYFNLYGGIALAKNVSFVHCTMLNG